MTYYHHRRRRRRRHRHRHHHHNHHFYAKYLQLYTRNNHISRVHRVAAIL